jgi:hypothetical protein
VIIETPTSGTKPQVSFVCLTVDMADDAEVDEGDDGARENEEVAGVPCVRNDAS